MIWVVGGATWPLGIGNTLTGAELAREPGAASRAPARAAPTAAQVATATTAILSLPTSGFSNIQPPIRVVMWQADVHSTRLRTSIFCEQRTRNGVRPR